MSTQSPSGSRPAPPVVAPVEYKNIRYEQDSQSKKYGGDSSSGYLVAIDPKTGNRLWMLKVYSALTLKPGAPSGDGEMYFGRMTLGPNEDELTIETEFGACYLVNLRLRTSTLIFSPGSNDPNDDFDLPDLMAPAL